MLMVLVCIPMVCAEPLVIGHRGSMHDGIGNTLSAIEKGGSANFIEIDIRVTQDKKLVVFHDHSINGKRIRDMTLHEIRRIPLPNKEKIPTLQDVFARFPSIKFVLDIKDKNVKKLVTTETKGQDVILIGTYNVIKEYEGNVGLVVPFKDVKNMMMFLFSPSFIVDRATRIGATILILPSQFTQKSLLQKVPKSINVWSYGENVNENIDGTITKYP